MPHSSQPHAAPRPKGNSEPRPSALCKGLFLSLALLAAACCANAQGPDRFEADPIRYSASEPSNAVARFQQSLIAGETTLEYDDRFGYLMALLKRLDIPVESQVLVFSKTSLQTDGISPFTPRAIYFNDDVYIGYVQDGSVLEISVADASLGAVFYTLPHRKGEMPRLTRETQNCLACHAGTLTRRVPGHIVRSVFSDAQGFPILTAGSFVTTQASPFNERWGGWYVTGTHGAMRHMGNGTAEKAEAGVRMDRDAGANRTELPDEAAASRYPIPHSDIVALMVLEHQTVMHNRITEAAFAARQALHDQAVMDEILGRPKDVLSESTQRRIAAAGDRLVDYMLFVGEFELEDAVRGTSGFAELFEARGPRDSQGNSLRDFDLETRLFANPLSYLIYSESFDALPEPMKDYVYRRLWDILTGVIATRDHLHLTNAVNRRIRRILVETKPGLPAYWTEPTATRRARG